MKRIAILLLALLGVPAVMAGTATLTWTAPTQYTDGSPIGTAPITYRVYGGVQGQTKTLIATVSALTYQHTGAPDGVTYCYQLTAVVNSQESARSTEGCKVMPPLVPNPPTGLQVVQVITGMEWSPVYKYTLANKRSADPAGYILVGKPCMGNVLFAYRGASFRQVLQSDVKFWATVESSNVAAPCAKT